MKHLNLLALIMIAGIFFYSCEKEEFVDELSVQEEPVLALDENNLEELPSALPEMRESDVYLAEPGKVTKTSPGGIQLRGGRISLEKSKHSIPAGKWYHLYYDIKDLDPDCKYIVKVTRISGDPDLWVFGRNYAGTFRTIRQPARGKVEESYGSRSDLIAYYAENRLFFSVYADQGKAAYFEIEVLKECVNCTVLQKEDFQAYRIGDRIAATNPAFWNTWSSGRRGTSRDPKISWADDNRFLYIGKDKVEDVLYDLGNRRSGKYELTMRIQTEGTAYFNIQNSNAHRVPGGVFRVYFGAYPDLNFWVKTNTGWTSSKTAYDYNDWNQVTMNFDFDRNEHQITINGRTIQLNSISGFSRLGAINFYAQKHAAAHFDDIVLQRCD